MTGAQEVVAKSVQDLVAIRLREKRPMSRSRMLIGGLVLLFAGAWGTGVPVVLQTVGAQESRPIVPGRLPIFQVDVMVDGRQLTPHHERGRIYVYAHYGEEYEIRVRNACGDRVAVALSVDGLNTIDASRTSAWDASKWLIEPGQTITIKGWQMSSEHARRFYFTNERDSYAAKLGQRGNLGVISAVFFRERRPQIVVPPSSSRDTDILREDRRSSAEASVEASPVAPSGSPAASAKSRPTRSRDEAATGIGRSVRHDVRYVDLDLDSRPAGEITIRYEFRSTFAPDPPCRVPCRRDN
jgi:hypothetical protein